MELKTVPSTKRIGQCILNISKEPKKVKEKKRYPTPTKIVKKL